MENIDFKFIFTTAYNLFYIVYMCKILFGGLTNKRIKPLQYIIMILLTIPLFLLQFNGIEHRADIINLCIILTLAIVKGIVLGRRKVVEKVGDIWYMHHDKIYIVIWVSIFAAKVLITQLIRVYSGAALPMWQAVAYFGVYYLVRTSTIFICNSAMRKDLFAEKLIQPKPPKEKGKKS